MSNVTNMFDRHPERAKLRAEDRDEHTRQLIAQFHAAEALAANAADLSRELEVFGGFTDAADLLNGAVWHLRKTAQLLTRAKERL